MADGDCYRAALRAILDADEGWVLAHGLVTGTRGKVRGVRFSHAWIEHPGSGFVRDTSNGQDLFVPRELYYEVGQIKDEEVMRYTPEQACKEALRTKNYGPWED